MVELLPDPSLRLPSVTALIPLFLIYYALALLLQPVFLWQAWRCVTEVDFAAWLAQSLGVMSAARINLFNSSLAIWIFIMVLRSFEWAFIMKEPIRRYKSTMNQNDLQASQRRLSVSSVFLDAFELFFNLRGIGWSCTNPESIPSVFATLLLNITIYDATQYLIQRAVSSGPRGGSLFDLNLSFFHRNASAAFVGICGGLWTYSLIEALYRMGALVGRVFFRQPASNWPPLFRHIFTTIGRPGAIMGAFTVSAVLHHVAFSTAGGFFLLMGVTGKRVRGFPGWLWTMLWILVWGTLMIDGWARHGMMADNIFPDRLRPGKALVDSIIGLLKKLL
ncbi:hypothetical protein EI94DRAFT_1926021 [Lactarius quietus]|nr:hypothetical protein EI94DRAFT_1926021 [Lactarius quietus]